MTPEVLSCVFLFAWLLEIIEIVSVIVLIYNLRTSKKCSECSRNGIETPSETVQDSPMVLHCYDDIILDAFYPEPRISQTEDKPDADCNSDTVVTATRRPLVPPMVLNDAILDATEPAVPDESTIPQPKSLEVDVLQQDKSLLALLPTTSLQVAVKKGNPFLSLFCSFPYFISHTAGMSPALRTARRFTVRTFQSFMSEIIFISAYLGDGRPLSKSLKASSSQSIVLSPRGQEMFSSQLIFNGKPPNKTTPMQWVKAVEMTFLIVRLQNRTSNQLQPATGSLVSQAAHIEDIERTASFVLMSANSKQDEPMLPLVYWGVARKRRNWFSLKSHKNSMTISALALQSKLLVITDQRIVPLQTREELPKKKSKAIEYGETGETAEEDDQSTICNTVSTLTPDTEEFFDVDEKKANDKQPQQETSSKQIEQLEKMVSALTQQLATYREEMTSLLYKKDCELNKVKQKLSEHVELIDRINANKDQHLTTYHEQMRVLLHEKDCELNEVKQKLSEHVELIDRINANKEQHLTTYREEMRVLLHEKDHELSEVKQKLSEHIELICRINANKDLKFNSHLCQPLQQQLATSLKEKEEDFKRLKAYLDKLLERVIEQAPHVLETMFNDWSKQ